MATLELKQYLAQALVSVEPCFLSREREKLNHKLNHLPQVPGGTSIKIGWGYAPRFLKPSPLLATKICHFPHPIYQEI